MHSVQPSSDLRPTGVQPRPAYLVRLTLDRLDVWSNTVLRGLGVRRSLRPPSYCSLPTNCGTSRYGATRRARNDDMTQPVVRRAANSTFKATPIDLIEQAAIPTDTARSVHKRPAP
jgi:hypothetical protein